MFALGLALRGGVGYRGGVGFMRERAVTVGASLQITSAPKAGTQVTLTVPTLITTGAPA